MVAVASMMLSVALTLASASMRRPPTIARSMVIAVVVDLDDQAGIVRMLRCAVGRERPAGNQRAVSDTQLARVDCRRRWARAAARPRSASR